MPPTLSHLDQAPPVPASWRWALFLWITAALAGFVGFVSVLMWAAAGFYGVLLLYALWSLTHLDAYRRRRS